MPTAYHSASTKHADGGGWVGLGYGAYNLCVALIEKRPVEQHTVCQ
jgi:hypothetical protein